MFPEKPEKPGRGAIRADEVKVKFNKFWNTKIFQNKFRFYLK